MKDVDVSDWSMGELNISPPLSRPKFTSKSVPLPLIIRANLLNSSGICSSGRRFSSVNPGQELPGKLDWTLANIICVYPANFSRFSCFSKKISSDCDGIAIVISRQKPTCVLQSFAHANILEKIGAIMKTKSSVWHMKWYQKIGCMSRGVSACNKPVIGLLPMRNNVLSTVKIYMKYKASRRNIAKLT